MTPTVTSTPHAMTEADYLQSRLDDQIAWYDRKSLTAQRAFKRLRFAEIVAAASIPVLSAYSGAPGVSMVIAVLGAGIAVGAGVLSLLQLQENWVKYRGTSETLKHEKFLFLTRTAPYDSQDPFPLLVQRVEGAISAENRAWTQQAAGTARAGKSQEQNS